VQELPIGYPKEPGILRGLAQRCGRTLAKLKTRAVVGVDTALTQVQTILRTVKEHHLFAKGKQAKRQVLTRLLTEVGALVVQTRLLVQGLGTRRDRVIEFIPLSFWYDAPLISQDSDRRHDPWLVYGSPSYSPAQWSSWISRA
jgi:hypothetical protein